VLFTQVYFGSKLCPTVLEILAPQVSAKDIRDFSMLNIYSSSRNYPSARCALADGVVYRDNDLYGTKTVSINHIL
jgi:hypothetical protein